MSRCFALVFWPLGGFLLSALKYILSPSSHCYKMMVLNLCKCSNYSAAVSIFLRKTWIWQVMNRYQMHINADKCMKCIFSGDNLIYAKRTGHQPGLL